MKYNEHNGRKISVIGYGCMRFPVIDGKNEAIDTSEAEKLLLHAIKNGINYLDTAYVYHGGNSEKFLGNFLKKYDMRDKITLATKLPTWSVEKFSDFERLLNEQLSNLQTDTIDYYLLHSLTEKRFDKIVELGVFDFMKKTRDDKKVLRWGFSFHDEYDAFEKIIKAYPWDFCQIQLNYLDKDYQAGLKGLALAESLRIKVIVMEPLKGGKLSNPPKDIRTVFGAFEGLSPSQAAIKYLLDKPNILTILSGMNELRQIDENIAVTDINAELTQKQLNALKKVREFFKSREKVGCTGCEYCLPCPADVAIPSIFSAYNNKYIFDESDIQQKKYDKLISDGKSAENCIECGQCESLCPQNLNIIDLLKETHEDFIK